VEYVKDAADEGFSTLVLRRNWLIFLSSGNKKPNAFKLATPTL
jgi:hypothetical protein